MLRIAIPNKGALSEKAAGLLLEAGYKCSRSGRELVVTDEENSLDFVFLRPRDIAVYVGKGILDLGITGRDLAVDSRAGVVEILELGFGKSALRYAVPEASELIPEHFHGLSIATSYPEIVRLDLERRSIAAHIVRLDGAVEISIQLGVADAVADVVESGRTLKEAGLKVVGEALMYSEAILIARNRGTARNPEVKRLLGRLRGILVARQYAMVEYDIPQEKCAKACKLTPGIESPTLSPLSKPGWVAVKAMIKHHESNRIMDELHKIGARGIIVTELQSCRL
ncbi:MAG: ATP phosphoribosyltransferase [Victivallaceae bacterium]|nr:ATP phosphoribosyltransferase [Victivallaceae bacterium]